MRRVARNASAHFSKSCCPDRRRPTKPRRRITEACPDRHRPNGQRNPRFRSAKMMSKPINDISQRNRARIQDVPVGTKTRMALAPAACNQFDGHGDIRDIRGAERSCPVPLRQVERHGCDCPNQRASSIGGRRDDKSGANDHMRVRAILYTAVRAALGAAEARFVFGFGTRNRQMDKQT